MEPGLIERTRLSNRCFWSETEINFWVPRQASAVQVYLPIMGVYQIEAEMGQKLKTIYRSLNFCSFVYIFKCVFSST